MTAKEIKKLRERMGVNQTEFAELIGTSQEQVSRWETGQVVPSGIARRRLEELRGETKQGKEQKP